MFEDCFESRLKFEKICLSEIEEKLNTSEITQYYYVKGDYIREGFANVKTGADCK